MPNIDWNQVQEWDKKYIIRTFATQSEYQPVPIESTEGDYLIMPDGTRLLDFFNQLYCVNAGQKNPKINNAIKAALDRYGFLWDAFATDYKSNAAKLLIEDILGDENWPGKVRFVSTGSEAVETALIIARLYTNRSLVITREHAYHGYTQAAASVTRLRGSRSGLTETQSQSTPMHVPGSFPPVVMAPAPNCLRCSLGHKYSSCAADDGELACVQYTRKMILNYGKEEVAAVITEVIQGAGSIQPPDEYIPQIRKLTKEMGILWIVDEILTGFGRTGKWFAYQHYGVEPDIVTCAKGLTSSSIPCGAVIVSREIAGFLDQYRWEHVSTFSGHPIAMAAACANLQYMIDEDLPGKAAKAGEYMAEKLDELKAKHNSIAKIDGKGALWLVEIVKDDSLRPYIDVDRDFTHETNPATFPTTIIRTKAIEKGVLVGGVMPNTLRIGASLNVQKEDIDKLADALDYAFTYFENAEN